jgi:hypothetical protein
MLLFYFITCVQKITSIFQVKIAEILIRLQIGGSTLHTGSSIGGTAPYNILPTTNNVHTIHLSQ